MTTCALEVLADADGVARRVADWLLADALAKPGRFAVALAGGSTPRRLYALLAQAPYLEAFPWARTHWFWGDERFVPHDDPLSNYRMVREAMLARVPIPAANIHPMTTEGVTPDEAAALYESDLRTFHGAPRLEASHPLFDVVLLGLGADGHTASLFPGTPALGEREKWVTAVEGEKPEMRLTLTYPALESCRNAAFLVTGAEKRERLGQLCRGGSAFPAARFAPAGSLVAFADRAAAEGLPQ